MTERSITSEPRYDYVFGFGSIINTATHAPWLATDETGSSTTLQGQRATILASFGYRRGWNFRSNTGFTALGIQRAQDASAINGVLFRIKHFLLEGFDRREVGYDRVEIARECIELIPPQSSERVEPEKIHTHHVLLNILPAERIWVYVPQESFYAEANEDHPILQSYVDTVMQGCLEWGGTQMAMEFISTTTSWSPYFLNDTPSSRRPWLFRKEYNTIDQILSQNPATHFADRRHPEEFASAFLIKMMRGAWSVPRRNTVFTGRDAEIGQIHARLTTQRTEQPMLSGVAKLEVAGMGGVGKTQIVTEYCYRYFPSYYGLVIWLRAPSAESIAAGYRQLMADTTGMDVNDKDTDEVVAEVKSRLFRSKVPWLLVFDNLEDHSLLEKFVPNGGIGHVLVTTRLINTDNVDFGDQTMILGCFNPSESVELLCRAAGKQNIANEAHLTAANKLADYLGHLPLALGMAAAYMRRCDVDCSEYLARYIKSESSGAHLGHEAVSSSLSLSLEAIKTENPVAWEALHLLSWLGPDQITKKLMRSLFSAKIAQENSQLKPTEENATISFTFTVVALVLASCSAFVIGRQALSRSRKLWGHTSISAVLLLSSTALVAHAIKSNVQKNDEEGSTAPISRTSSFSVDVFEQTDQTWEVLKSFSILVVKEGKGSIHRLLSQTLRLTQNEEEARENLDISLRAVSNAWAFQPHKVDTWQASTAVLEHVKAVVDHSVEQEKWALETAIMSKEAGVFSAMALNRFEQAQSALEESLLILDHIGITNPAHLQARAAALYELGRVFRYEGNFGKSEEALRKALEIRNRLARKDPNARHDVAATLHELGVLEVKKHNLDSAATVLQKALDLRRILELESPVEDMEAECASTLHQLAAVHVAQKPPALDRAEALLKEALGLNMQLYQRAGTLKLKARVSIRRGDFYIAEKSLAQALELYAELYGENTPHINIAAVKFQQGTLAFQREQYEQAWVYFSECLRARRQVYSYTQGNHLEVSSVFHKLGCVSFAQKRISKACEMLRAEKEILDQLSDSSRPERLLQARLTNLTWLRKCAKEMGDEDLARTIAAERSSLENNEKQRISTEDTRTSCAYPCTPSLQRELLDCRSAARHYAMSEARSEETSKESLKKALESLSKETEQSLDCPMKESAVHFQQMVTESIMQSNKRLLFAACDDLRDSLREQGVQVVDSIHGKSKAADTTS